MDTAAVAAPTALPKLASAMNELLSSSSAKVLRLNPNKKLVFTILFGKLLKMVLNLVTIVNYPLRLLFFR